MRAGATEGRKLSGVRCEIFSLRQDCRPDGTLEKLLCEQCFHNCSAEGESAWRESLRQKDKVVSIDLIILAVP